MVYILFFFTYFFPNVWRSNFVPPLWESWLRHCWWVKPVWVVYSYTFTKQTHIICSDLKSILERIFDLKFWILDIYQYRFWVFDFWMSNIWKSSKFMCFWFWTFFLCTSYTECTSNSLILNVHSIVWYWMPREAYISLCGIPILKIKSC